MARIGVIQSELYHSTVADRCPACQKMGEMDLVIKQGIFMLGLPLFPTSKTAIITCPNCKNSIDPRWAPRYVAERYQEQLQQAKTPKWAFAGAVIFGAVIIFALIRMPQEKKEHTTYINAPHIGDVYEINYDDKDAIFRKDRYSLLKVIDTSGSEITFLTCAYEATKSSKLYSIKQKPEDELWLDETVTYTKQQLIGMLDFDAKPVRVSDIERK